METLLRFEKSMVSQKLPIQIKMDKSKTKILCSENNIRNSNIENHMQLRLGVVKCHSWTNK